MKELKDQKLEKEKKDKEKENLKTQANKNIALLQAQIEDINKKLIPLLDFQENDQGEENAQIVNINQEEDNE